MFMNHIILYVNIASVYSAHNTKSDDINFFVNLPVLLLSYLSVSIFTL